MNIEIQDSIITCSCNGFWFVLYKSSVKYIFILVDLFINSLRMWNPKCVTDTNPRQCRIFRAFSLTFAFSLLISTAVLCMPPLYQYMKNSFGLIESSYPIGMRDKGVWCVKRFYLTSKLRESIIYFNCTEVLSHGTECKHVSWKRRKNVF
jgi:hypothetical protein